jgi:hypothetical protein
MRMKKACTMDIKIKSTFNQIKMKALSSSGLGYPALNRITLVRIQLVLLFYFFFNYLDL